MTTITIKKTSFSYKTDFLDDTEFFDYFFWYIQDLEDIHKVKNEIKNDDWYRVNFDKYLENV